jgi:sialate O-acetylesterase
MLVIAFVAAVNIHAGSLPAGQLAIASAGAISKPAANIGYPRSATWDEKNKGLVSTLSRGNLVDAIGVTAGWDSVRATRGFSSGKWYWEITVTTIGKSGGVIGVGTAATSLSNNFCGADANSWGYQSTGVGLHGGAPTDNGAAGYGRGDVIGVALDMDNGTLIFYKNGVSQGQFASGLRGTFYPIVSGTQNAVFTANFGARAFAHGAPAVFESAGPAAHVSLSRIFTKHMILQRDSDAPIWGTADPDGIVTVSVAGRTSTAKVDSSRNWRVVLHQLPAGGPYKMTIRGRKDLVIDDVLVGDVYIASGQSNMTYSILSDPTNSKAAARMHDAALREFWPFWSPMPTPQFDFIINSLWITATQPASYAPEGQAKKAALWCAICYYFGAQLRKEEGVPIGIIDAGVGGVVGQTLISAEAVAKHPILQKAAEAYMNPERAAGHEVWHWTPGIAFNTQINPMVGYGIKGVLWYQGEGNAGPADLDGKDYEELLATLIADWRTRWGKELPFYIVQLPGYGISEDPNVVSRIAFVREGQMHAISSIPKTGLVITVDLNNPGGDTHPVDKLEVGLRIARLVLHGQTGPIYSGSTTSKGGITVRFSHTESGLSAKAGSLRCFAIAGRDKKFVRANAQIEGDTVRITNPRISNPVSARYAWADYPRGCNLYNSLGLPASPFRTDTW